MRITATILATVMNRTNFLKQVLHSIDYADDHKVETFFSVIKRVGSLRYGLTPTYLGNKISTTVKQQKLCDTIDYHIEQLDDLERICRDKGDIGNIRCSLWKLQASSLLGSYSTIIKNHLERLYGHLNQNDLLGLWRSLRVFRADARKVREKALQGSVIYQGTPINGNTHPIIDVHTHAPILGIYWDSVPSDIDLCCALDRKQKALDMILCPNAPYAVLYQAKEDAYFDIDTYMSIIYKKSWDFEKLGFEVVRSVLPIQEKKLRRFEYKRA